MSMMRPVSISGDHKISIIETAVPKLDDSEVLVKPCSCGICGTDLHILHQGFPATNYPVIPGHEFAGYIVAVAKGVKNVKEGDFVAVDPNVVCGQCRWCKMGHPNLCIRLTPIGVGRPGAAAEFVNVPSHNAFNVKAELGGELAALIEPQACVLHVADSSQGVKHRTILVFGGGTMGQLIAIVCHLKGAARVVIADFDTAAASMAAGQSIKTQLHFQN